MSFDNILMDTKDIEKSKDSFIHSSTRSDACVPTYLPSTRGLPTYLTRHVPVQPAALSMCRCRTCRSQCSDASDPDAEMGFLSAGDRIAVM